MPPANRTTEIRGAFERFAFVVLPYFLLKEYAKSISRRDRPKFIFSKEKPPISRRFSIFYAPRFSLRYSAVENPSGDAVRRDPFAPVSRILSFPTYVGRGGYLSSSDVTVGVKRHSRTPTLPSSFLCQLWLMELAKSTVLAFFRGIISRNDMGTMAKLVCGHGLALTYAFSRFISKFPWNRSRGTPLDFSFGVSVRSARSSVIELTGVTR